MKREKNILKIFLKTILREEREKICENKKWKKTKEIETIFWILIFQWNYEFIFILFFYSSS